MLVIVYAKVFLMGNQEGKPEIGPRVNELFHVMLEPEASVLSHGVLQCVAVRCSVLQCVVMCYSVLQCVAVCCSVVSCVAARYIVLRRNAVCCCVLLCVAVCCHVLRCGAPHCNTCSIPLCAIIAPHRNTCVIHICANMYMCKHVYVQT